MKLLLLILVVFLFFVFNTFDRQSLKSSHRSTRTYTAWASWCDILRRVNLWGKPWRPQSTITSSPTSRLSIKSANGGHHTHACWHTILWALISSIHWLLNAVAVFEMNQKCQAPPPPQPLPPPPPPLKHGLSFLSGPINMLKHARQTGFAASPLCVVFRGFCAALQNVSTKML